MSERTKIGAAIGLALIFAAAMSQCGPASVNPEINAEAKPDVKRILKPALP